ncbi:MAG: hypothetical protein V7723_16840 [Sneathiella sp.]|uniref:hypothetical protein n=1 Tax=Sneathiella sp. TaxID=1964365 RepID=UPI003003509E
MLLVVLFIRAVSGHRQAAVTENSARGFLSLHEPHLHIASLQIDRNEKTAVVSWQETDDIGLVRSFGDKLVLQTFSRSDLIQKSEADGDYNIQFPRQGFAHPPAAVKLLTPFDFQANNPSSEGAMG